MIAQKVAFIVGATGVVGRHCLDELLQAGRYARIVAIGRRSTGKKHSKLAEIVLPLDRLGDIRAPDIGPIDDAFCCLGTTQKSAGSHPAFRHIEVEFPRASARLAKANGATHIALVSSLGADSRSANFYLKVKGEVEAAVTAEGLDSVSIFRPSLLLGDREEFRWKEKLSEPLLRGLGVFMIGSARALRPILAVHVARAMVEVATAPLPGTTIYGSDRIAAIAAA